MTPLAGAVRLVSWAALVCVALLPLLPQLGALVPPVAPLERLFGGWFELHCHRETARTLQLVGLPMAVCARCAGIYFGLGIGGLARKPWLSPPRLRAWLAVAAALMISDVLLEAHALRGAWWPLRVATGGLLGYPVGAVLGAWLTARRPSPATAG